MTDDKSRHRAGRANQRVRKRPWQLLSVRLAIIVTLLGAGMWVYSLATRPAESSETVTTDGQKSHSGISSGFAAGGDRSSESSRSTADASPQRAVDSAAPATFRIGASFLAAFSLGILMRKFLRWSLLIVGLAVVAIYLLRRSGAIDMPWEQIEGDVREGATWLQAQAGSVKEFLTGYLPSGAAAFVGGAIGFWRG